MIRAEVRNLCKSFGKHKVLKNVSFRFRINEIVGFNRTERGRKINYNEMHGVIDISNQRTDHHRGGMISQRSGSSLYSMYRR